MLTAAFVFELLFVIGFPLALGAWLRRRFGASWLLFAAGAVTFGLSQAVHLPLNEAIFALTENLDSLPRWGAALVLGLTAGLCEEGARYGAYRWVLKELRDWRGALMFGAGHGGIESLVLVGLIVGVVFLNMAALQGADLESWGLPAGQVAQLQGQLAGYWGQDWTGPLLGALERLLTVIFHMGMAVLVLNAVVRGRPAYWLLAVGLHTAVNAAALSASWAGWSLMAVEGVVALFALAALGIIGWAARGGPAELPATAPAEAVLPPLPPLPSEKPRAPTAEERLREQIEASKYQR